MDARPPAGASPARGRAPVWVALAGGYALAMGVAVLLGWLLDVGWLRGTFARGIAMKFNAALCYVCLGAALILTARSVPGGGSVPGLRGRRSRWLARALAATAVLIAAATLSEHLAGWDLGIDELFVRDRPFDSATTSAGRMGVPGSASIALAGTALLLVLAPPRRPRGKALDALPAVLALAVCLIGTLSIVGYLYGADQLYGVARYTGIAAVTATVIVVLGLGLLLARPDREPMRALLAETPAATMARRGLPLVLFTILALGLLRLRGQAAGLYDTAFGTAVLTLALTAGLTAVVWAAVWTLGRRDAELRRAEEERERLLESERAARGEAERAVRLKEEFLATVSHELRTPLHVVLGWAQLLRRTRDEDALAKGLEAIERGARAQGQLIEELLDTSRIVAGKARLDLQLLELAPLVEAALEMLRPAAEAKSIRLERKLDPAAGPVRGDAERLQQVVWNLLSNAIKFTPEGGHVRVELSRTGFACELRVKDTGVGIAPAFLPLVFDRFRQADSSTARAHRGLGLGLSIVKQLVQLHGGAVVAESAGEGRGATFTVSLPLVTDPLPADRGVRPRGAGSVSLADVRVLVVDDDRDSCEVVGRMLAGCAARVDLAYSADEALAGLERFRPDVLVSDIGMPGKDGYELVAALRRRERGSRPTPAVALTAFTRGEDRARALEAGFDAFVPKPVSPGELAAVIASLVPERGPERSERLSSRAAASGRGS